MLAPSQHFLRMLALGDFFFQIEQLFFEFIYQPLIVLFQVDRLLFFYRDFRRGQEAFFMIL